MVFGSPTNESVSANRIPPSHLCSSKHQHPDFSEEKQPISDLQIINQRIQINEAVIEEDAHEETTIRAPLLTAKPQPSPHRVKIKATSIGVVGKHKLRSDKLRSVGYET